MENLFGGRAKKSKKQLTPVRLIVLSFLGMILIGTVLLIMPISSRDGTFTSVIDAVFTATSATCITGLSVFDTWVQWSFFGQMVILVLIQVGGLGLVTFTTGATLLFRQKLGLKDLALARESSGVDTLDMKHLLRTVFIFTFSMEFIGAVVLAIRFIPEAGFLGLWIAIFTAISAFCNAGFDIFSSLGDGISTNTFAADPMVAITISGLIIVGGLGFVVVSDIFLRKMWPTIKKEHRRRLSLHSKIVLIATPALLISGLIIVMVVEYNHALKGYNFGEKILVSFFQSSSTRTSGFSAINYGDMHLITKIFSVVYMFIGGAPSSMAGGIKLTSVLVLTMTVVCVMRAHSETSIMKHRIDKTLVYQALSIFICSMSIAITTAIILICTVDGASGIDALYGSISATSTSGFSTPYMTPDLHIVAKITLMVTMFIGRVGAISLGLMFADRKVRHSILPDGKIIVL